MRKVSGPGPVSTVRATEAIDVQAAPAEVAELPPVATGLPGPPARRPAFKMGRLFGNQTRAVGTCLLALTIGFSAAAQGAPVSDPPEVKTEVVAPAPTPTQGARFFVPQSRTVALDGDFDSTGSANYSLESIRLDDHKGPRNNNGFGFSLSNDDYQAEVRLGHNNGAEQKLGVTKIMGDYSVGLALQRLNNNEAPVATIEARYDLPITNHLVGGAGVDAGFNMRGQPYAKAELGLRLDTGFAGISLEGRGSIDTDRTEKLQAGLRMDQGDWAVTGTITHVSDQAHWKHNDPGDIGFRIGFQYSY